MQAELEDEYVEYVTGLAGCVRRFAFLLCGDGHRADDLVQQTIAKLYERWRRTRTVGQLDPAGPSTVDIRRAMGVDPALGVALPVTATTSLGTRRVSRSTGPGRLP